MKHKSFLLVILIIILSIISGNIINVYGVFDPAQPLSIYRNTKFADITAPSFVVYERGNVNKVLYSKNGDEKRAVASLVKMMTVYIAYEYINVGRLNLTDMIVTTAHAAEAPGKTAFISTGDSFDVNSALYAIIIQSCNDVTVALAEHIGNTESEFVNLMNLHAKNLGMNNTKFVDSTGISDEGYSTAKDMVLLANAILTKYPQYLEISAERYIVGAFKNGTNKIDLENTNRFSRFIPQYTEGLKTGSTLEAMYCMAADYNSNKSNEYENRNLIVVMLGASSEDVLYGEARRALEYCVANFYENVITEENMVVKQDVTVKKGKADKVNFEMSGEIKHIINESDKDKIEIKTEGLETEELPEEVEAPLKKGQVIGKAKYILNGQVIGEMDIVISEDVEKAGWFKIMIDWLLEWFGFKK